MKNWITLLTIFLFLKRLVADIIELPQIPLQVNETHYLDITEFFIEADMDIKVITSDKSWNSSTVKINTTDILKKEYSMQISTESFQVAFQRPSLIVHSQIKNNQKQYFFAVFNNKFDFFLYDITDYNVLNGKVNPIVLLLKTSLLTPDSTTNYEYSACQGLRYRGNVIFYSVCWDWQDRIYIASIDVQGIDEKSKVEQILNYKVSQKQLKNSEFRPSSKYVVFNNAYIFYPKYFNNTSTLENFWYWGFLDIKEGLDEHGWLDFMIPKMKSKIDGLIHNTSNPFAIGDIRMLDNQYLLMTDNNYGIFIFRFFDGTFNLNGEPYLYKLNSYPNRIHVETPSHNVYQIIITTAKSNEVLIFMPIEYGANWSASEVLKLDRIHAFLLPKYYSFGLYGSINSKYLINELYNSVEKIARLSAFLQEIKTLLMTQR